MSNDLGQSLAALKHNLQTAREFMAPWHQFHDDVAVASLAAPVGVPADNPRRVRCIAAVAGHVFRAPGADTVEDPCFSHVAEHGFWHGSCFVGGRVAICFWFEDDDIGLVGFLASPDSREVTLARLRPLALPSGAWRGVAGDARRN